MVGGDSTRDMILPVYGFRFGSRSASRKSGRVRPAIAQKTRPLAKFGSPENALANGVIKEG